MSMQATARAQGNVINGVDVSALMETVELSVETY
jgi:hypothetical protein